MRKGGRNREYEEKKGGNREERKGRRDKVGRMERKGGGKKERGEERMRRGREVLSRCIGWQWHD